MEHVTIRKYQIGFVLSILLTLIAFGLVREHLQTSGEFLSQTTLYTALVLLALTQLFVQLIFFLHVGKGGSVANQVMLAFTIVIVVIVVGGALWIMSSLNNRMMIMPSTEQMIQYIDEKG